MNAGKALKSASDKAPDVANVATSVEEDLGEQCVDQNASNTRPAIVDNLGEVWCCHRFIHCARERRLTLCFVGNFRSFVALEPPNLKLFLGSDSLGGLPMRSFLEWAICKKSTDFWTEIDGRTV